RDAAEDRAPRPLHELGLSGRVDHLVHLDVRAGRPRLDPEVAGFLATRAREVVVAEVPAKPDQLRRAAQLVPAAHTRPPPHLAGEPLALDCDGHAEPARVD